MTGRLGEQPEDDPGDFRRISRLPLLVLPTYQRAERVEKKAAEQSEMFGG